MSFAAGGAAVFIAMLLFAGKRRPEERVELHEKQYLNFLNYDGTERGQQKLDD